MATGDGVGFHTIEIKEHLKETGQEVVKKIIHRQVFWARYIDVGCLASAVRILAPGFIDLSVYICNADTYHSGP